jgi:hypothetical protein
MDQPNSRPTLAGGERRHALRTTRETAIDALRTMLAALLAATGIATLVGISSIASLFAAAGVPDLFASIIAVLLIANGALLLIRRFAFVATIAPVAIAFFWAAASLRAGDFAVACAAIVVAAGLFRVAGNTQPAGLRTSGMEPATTGGHEHA